MVPDIVSAALARLYSLAAVTALTTQMSAEWQGEDSVTPWTMPGYAVLVRRTGGFGETQAGLRDARLDFAIYGADGRRAALLWRTIEAALCPPPPGPRSFVAAHCVVHDVYAEAEPIADRDPDTGYYRTLCAYRFTYHGVSV